MVVKDGRGGLVQSTGSERFETRPAIMINAHSQCDPQKNLRVPLTGSCLTTTRFTRLHLVTGISSITMDQNQGLPAPVPCLINWGRNWRDRQTPARKVKLPTRRKLTADNHPQSSKRIFFGVCTQKNHVVRITARIGVVGAIDFESSRSSIG